jgi:hypothetical protein
MLFLFNVCFMDLLVLYWFQCNMYFIVFFSAKYYSVCLMMATIGQNIFSTCRRMVFIVELLRLSSKNIILHTIRRYSIIFIIRQI